MTMKHFPEIRAFSLHAIVHDGWYASFVSLNSAGQTEAVYSTQDITKFGERFSRMNWRARFNSQREIETYVFTSKGTVTWDMTDNKYFIHAVKRFASMF